MTPRAASLCGVLLSTMAFLASNASAQIVGVPGTVAEVSEADVAIRVYSEQLPAKGDTVEIGFQSNSGEHVTIGIWKVVDVGDCLAWVRPVCTTEKPTAGMDALVFRRAPELMAEQAVATTAGLPLDHRDATGVILANIEALGSPDTAVKRRAAKTLYRHYRYKEDVQQAAETYLLAEYNLNTTDGNHVDAMAWLCNILGASRLPIYRDALSEVTNNATNHKVKAYASKNLRRLG